MVTANVAVARFLRLEVWCESPQGLHMRFDPIDAKLFQANRRQLMAMLKPRSIVVLHANDIMPTNADGVMPYIQNTDLYYLTGVNQEETVLILFPDAAEEKDRELLFVKETSELIAIWEGEKLTKQQATDVSGIQHVHWTDAFEGHLHRLVPQVLVHP